ncbi:MAG: hypothetical protein WCS97_03320 [Candidatus Paceibacterota bacterium]|jgi:hypothetical protein
MKKDMLGSIVRAAVGVPQNRLEVLAKIASAIAEDNPNGNEWFSRFENLLKEELSSKTAVVFERNEYGHIVFTITGLDLTGAQEITRLTDAKYRIGDYAKQMLTSTKPDGYDAKHRLVAGQSYMIVLIPGKEIENDSGRTTANLQKLGEKLGYDKPLAGIVQRIREAVSDKQMEEMGFWYIAGLHNPITGADGRPGVLGAGRDDDGRWLFGYWGIPDGHWDGDGAFAFVLPAS